jgi:hypothetical protein
MAKTVHIAFCVDTEGPLYENLEAKFERLRSIFGIDHIAATPENFEKLRRGEMDLGGKEALVQKTFSSHLSNYMDDWGKLDAMLDRVMDRKFRMRLPDSFGRPFLYNWFCVDHVEYTVNPRRRTLGYHAIFDHYLSILHHQPEFRDGLQWHLHPMSTYKEAHRSATSFLNSPHAITGLARRIIERQWFPSCFRAGFHAERPDLHWFLEQYIPFDFSNTSMEDSTEQDVQADLGKGRFGDWRLAPKDWGVYHPSPDNYQIPGSCRRWIARALNILNRFASINAYEVEKAFRQAQEGKPTLLAIGTHDFRDMQPEVECFQKLLTDAQAKYPDVQFKYCEAREAFREVAFGGKLGEALELKTSLLRDEQGRPHRLVVETVKGKVFGPQPFLAVKTRSGRFIHENFDFGTDLKTWSYTFDMESIRQEDLDMVGLGANDQYGNTCVITLDAKEEAKAWALSI